MLHDLCYLQTSGKGSGIAEALVSLLRALLTKHQEDNIIGELYIICLMLMYEALMHLILNQYHVESQLNASTLDLLATLRDPETNSQESLACHHV